MGELVKRVLQQDLESVERRIREVSSELNALRAIERDLKQRVERQQKQQTAQEKFRELWGDVADERFQLIADVARRGNSLKSMKNNRHTQRALWTLNAALQGEMPTQPLDKYRDRQTDGSVVWWRLASAAVRITGADTATKSADLRRRALDAYQEARDA